MFRKDSPTFLQNINMIVRQVFLLFKKSTTFWDNPRTIHVAKTKTHGLHSLHHTRSNIEDQRGPAAPISDLIRIYPFCPLDRVIKCIAKPACTNLSIINIAHFLEFLNLPDIFTVPL